MYYTDSEQIKVGDICYSKHPSLFTIAEVIEVNEEEKYVKVTSPMGLLTLTKVEELPQSCKLFGTFLAYRKSEIDAIVDKFYKKELPMPTKEEQSLWR